jgi:hypothetical protein
MLYIEWIEVRVGLRERRKLTGSRQRTGMRRHWRYAHPGLGGALRVVDLDGGGGPADACCMWDAG